MSQIAPAAHAGFAAASAYDAHRPSYPDTAVNNLLQHLGVLGLKRARIVDLAAGTGKFTELLAERPEGYEIVAVEPHAEMRGVLEGKVREKGWKNVRVVEGTAKDMGAVEGDWADAVIVAQAFHWFANEDSLKEIYRVIIPSGTLGLIWNVEYYNSPVDWQPPTVWEAKLKELMWSGEDLSPRFRNQQWQKVFEDQLESTPATIQAADPLFSLPLGKESVEWSTWLTKEGVWDRFHTISHVAVLEGEELEATKKKAFEALNGEDAKPNEKGEIELHGVTFSAWTTAIPGAPLSNGG